MSPIILFYVFLLTSSSTLDNVFCEKLADIKKTDTFLINNAVIDILKSCYRSENRAYTTVGFSVPTNDLLSAIFSDMDLFIDILIIEETDTVAWKKMKLPHKLQYSIITASNNYEFLDFYHKMKLGMQTDRYILLQNNPSTEHCENGQNFFNLMSHQQNLNVIFVCVNERKIVMVYEFHVINDNAPEPWELEKVDYNSANERYTMYKRIFDPKTLTCNSLFFDKTSTLTDRVIEANVMYHSPWMIFDYNTVKALKTNHYLLDYAEGTAGIYLTRVKPHDWNLFSGFDGLVMGTIFKFLNATVIMKIYPVDSKSYRTTGFFNFDMLADLHRQTEIRLNNREIISRIDESISFTYPVIQRELTIVTNKQNNLSVQRRIASFFNGSMIVSIFLVFFLLVLVLGCCVRQKFSPVALNAFRFILSVNFRYVLTNWSARIFIGCFIPYFLLLFINFQSNITQIATVARVMPNIDSLDSLNTTLNSCKAYSSLNFQRYLHLLRDVGCSLNKNNNTNCTDYVLQDSQAVCVDDSLNLMNDVAKNPKLHLMKEPMKRNYASYPTKSNWFLQKRVDTLLSRLKESGIVTMWLTKHYKSPAIDHKFSKRQFQAVSLNQCWGVFFVLLIGLLIATVAFIIELWVVYARIFKNDFLPKTPLSHTYE